MVDNYIIELQFVYLIAKYADGSHSLSESIYDNFNQ